MTHNIKEVKQALLLAANAKKPFCACALCLSS